MDVVSSGLRFAHAKLPPHDTDSPTVTGRFQIGVAFSAHRDVCFSVGGRAGVATYGGGAVICSADEEIVWSRVREPTEALEIYPDPALVRRLSGGGTTWPVGEALVGRSDPVVLAVASVLRRAHATGAELDAVATSALAHRLVAHLLVAYGGLPARTVVGAPTGHTRLTPRALATVAEVVEARLAGELSLEVMAASVHLSPFHFARAFKATTGVTPWEFVSARRLDRARLLLRTTDDSVEAVTAAVGLSNVSHFRRLFVAHTGCSPGRYRSLVR
ncbi:hypothetical protein GCM10029964_073900 [Kibdelosporangium lantanae]